MSDSGAYLAFETGGSKLVAGLAGGDGRLVKVASIERRPGDRARASFGRIVRTAAQLLADRPRLAGQLRSVGFGFGGTVRRSANSPHICLHEDGWDGIDVAADLERQFGVPAFVENDCKLAALAEAHFGAGRGAKSLFYVTLGTGVGGGYVGDGRILPFGDLGEAEIGHVVVDPEGPECCCGNAGCVEAMCSGPGLSKLATVVARREPSMWAASSLSSTRQGLYVDSHDLIGAWDAGDGFAGSVMGRAVTGLASALGAAVNLMVPRRIVIGGGVGTSTPLLLDCLRREMPRWVVPYFRDSYSIAPSALRTDAVTQGAAVLARQRVRDARHRPDT